MTIENCNENIATITAIVKVIVEISWGDKPLDKWCDVVESITDILNSVDENAKAPVLATNVVKSEVDVIDSMSELCYYVIRRLVGSFYYGLSISGKFHTGWVAKPESIAIALFAAEQVEEKIKSIAK